MTTVPHSLSMTRAAGTLPAAALVLRWEISPDVIRASPLPAIASMNGQASRITRALLEWRIEHGPGGSAAATLRLEVGEDDVLVPLEHRSFRTERIGEFEHFDSGPALRLTVRDGELIYARTDLLQRALGLGGGVYDGPTVA